VYAKGFYLLLYTTAPRTIF